MNLAGKTSLKEFVSYIAQAKLVVGNDSAAGHVAAALGTISIVIAGGAQWGRCYPYHVDKSSTVRRLPRTVSVVMPCFGCDLICNKSSDQSRVFPCVEAITVGAVTKAIQEELDY